MNSISNQTSRLASRDHYIDNIKGVFIYLVVLGHLLDYLNRMDVPFSIGMQTLIYFFHMPGFVFLSGYLAKSFVKKRFKGEILLNYAWLYLLFKIAIEIVQKTFDRPYFAGTKHNGLILAITLGYAILILILAWAYRTYPVFQTIFMILIVAYSLVKVNIFYVGATPWYLLSLIFWYIFIYLTKNMNPKCVMLAAVVMAAVLDYQEEIGKFLSLSRTINFLPFFLLGFYMTREQFYRIMNHKKLKVILPVIFYLLMAVILRFGTHVRKACGIFIFGVSSYEGLSDEIYGYAPLFALLWMAVATIMFLAVFIICPRKKTFLSTIGKNSIAVYVFHRLVKDLLYYLGFYSVLSSNQLIAVGQVALAALGVTLLFGNPLSAKIVTDLSEIKAHWFYKNSDLYYEEFRK